MNPHWLVDQLVHSGIDEIRLPKNGFVQAMEILPDVRPYIQEAFELTFYDRYHRVPGSMRWWYKIT